MNTRLIPGTNYFAVYDENVNIAFTNEFGFAIVSDCIGNPNMVATDPGVFWVGCLMIRNDIMTGNNLYANQGTLISPNWVLFGGGGSGLWTPQGITTFPVGGIPAGTDLGTTPIDVTVPGGVLDQAFYAYIAAHISLITSPTNSLRENGDAIPTIALDSTITKHSNAIVSVTYFRNASLIHTNSSPNPAGGADTYTDTTPVSANTSYQSKVFDGTTTSVSNIVPFDFVSAYYYGSAAPGLDISADGGGLTKLVIDDTASVSKLFTNVDNVPYFAYDDSYPPLSLIKDANGFDVTSDWTVTTGIAVTNSFGVVNTYRVYQFNNLTTQSNFMYTFIQ